MIETIMLGVLLGVSLSLMVGPAMFMLLQVCIKHGFKRGFALSMGVLTSDVFILLLCYFGASQVIGDNPRENMYIGLIGGMVMLIFGSYSFFRGGKKDKLHHTSYKGLKDGTFIKEVELKEMNSAAEKEVNEIDRLSEPRRFTFFVKGFLLNLANPGIWFLWIVTMAKVVSIFPDDYLHISLFFVSVFVTIVSFDLLKNLFSCYLKNKLNDHIIAMINKVVGLIIMGFGVFIIINTFIDLQKMITALVNS